MCLNCWKSGLNRDFHKISFICRCQASCEEFIERIKCNLQDYENEEGEVIYNKTIEEFIEKNAISIRFVIFISISQGRSSTFPKSIIQDICVN